MDTRFNVSLICDTLLPTWIVYRGKADTLSSLGKSYHQLDDTLWMVGNRITKTVIQFQA